MTTAPAFWRRSEVTAATDISVVHRPDDQQHAPRLSSNAASCV